MMERSLKNYETLLGSLVSREEQIAHGTGFLKLSLRYCALLSHSERYFPADCRHGEAIGVAERCL
jgi:hypothetical protein